MLQLKKSASRGSANHGWLKSNFSFSFADYYDPNNMGFRALRVINEDHVAANSGFPMHPHRNMEIITYMVSGALAHEDSHGHKALIQSGEVQRMSAGSGVFHSEFNPSGDTEAHLLQVWILPDRSGGSFGYDQKSFVEDLKEKKLVLAVSEDGREGSLAIRQDADLYLSRLKKTDFLNLPFRPTRHFWLQLIRGALEVNGLAIEAGDALRGSGESELKISAQAESEFLLFDLV